MMRSLPSDLEFLLYKLTQEPDDYVKNLLIQITGVVLIFCIIRFQVLNKKSEFIVLVVKTGHYLGNKL